MTTLLVPSDFSANATAALRYAIQLNRFLKSTLIVFHCSHISAYALTAASTKEQMNLLLKEDEQDKLEKLQDQVQKAYKYLDIKKIPASTKCLVEYNPMVVENTIDVAKKNDAGLIIMGTHGATGIKKFFFGSNTSIMISKSPVPVLAIPGNYTYAPLQTIVFSSDLQNLPFELNLLLPFAIANKAAIDVLYLDYGIDTDSKKINNAETLILKTPYKKIKLVKQKATIESSLVDQVKKYISKNKPGCLVMFTRERSLWDRLFAGSKTEDMSAALNVPLLSFKKENNK